MHTCQTHYRALFPAPPDSNPQLARTSDVVVENYQPGKLKDMGLGYDEISRVNKDIVYVSITGYGDKGPYRDMPGYDVMASSLGGLIGVTGSADEPARPGAAVTDVITGTNAQAAVAFALRRRDNVRAERSRAVDESKVVDALARSEAALDAYKAALQGGGEAETPCQPAGSDAAPCASARGVDDPQATQQDGLAIHIQTSLFESQVSALANIGMVSRPTYCCEPRDDVLPPLYRHPFPSSSLPLPPLPPRALTRSLLSPRAQAYLAGGVVGRRNGTQHGSIAPYECVQVAPEEGTALPASAPSTAAAATPATHATAAASTSSSASASADADAAAPPAAFMALGALNNKQFAALVRISRLIYLPHSTV